MKILIADDHQVVRQGLKQLLGEVLSDTIFGEAATTAETLKLVWDQEWDLILLDISMPGRSGMDALMEIRQARPRTPVLVLSMHEEVEYAIRVLKAGAAGYVTKKSLAVELVNAVHKVISGQRYVSTELAQSVLESLGAEMNAQPHRELSPREFEIMKLLAIGRSVKEIALDLSLSPKTVFTHRTHLLTKIGVRNDVELARYALRHGIVD